MQNVAAANFVIGGWNERGVTTTTGDTHAMLRMHFIDRQIAELFDLTSINASLAIYDQILPIPTDQETLDWATENLSSVGWAPGHNIAAADEQRANPFVGDALAKAQAEIFASWTPGDLAAVAPAFEIDWINYITGYGVSEVTFDGDMDGIEEPFDDFPVTYSAWEAPGRADENLPDSSVPPFDVVAYDHVYFHPANVPETQCPFSDRMYFDTEWTRQSSLGTLEMDAYLAQDQTRDGKYVGHWNPLGLHGLPQDSINFLGHLTIDSPTLVSDIKVLWENMIGQRLGDQNEYFTGRAREYGEAISLAIVELQGNLTFPALYEAINLMAAGGDEWLDFAFHMSRSRFPLVRRIEAEIAASRTDTTGGFRGIIGELMRSVACLSDPLLMASVSPPFTLKMEDIVLGATPWQLYLMPPPEFISAWAPVLKSAFVSAALLKSRAPQANRISFLIDECGQLAKSGFDLLVTLYTVGAGLGTTTYSFWQSNRQMRNLGPDAESLILSSAGAKLMFAVRDLESAKDFSAMTGLQTLSYEDVLEQERARHARNTALHNVLTGGDILQAGLSLAHHSYAMDHRSEQQRHLLQPEEVINMGGQEAILFHEDVPYPIKIARKPYWSERQLAGLYHPNPYHPPLDRVQIQTRWGKRWRPVITEPVPEGYGVLGRDDIFPARDQTPTCLFDRPGGCDPKV